MPRERGSDPVFHTTCYEARLGASLHSGKNTTRVSEPCTLQVMRRSLPGAASPPSAAIDSIMERRVSVALGSHVVVPAYETGQRLNVFDVPRLGRFGNRYVDDPRLREYLDRILPSLTESVWRRFYRCDIQQKHSVLARMRGYETGWQMCPWSSDQFMEMLLANDGRRYPHVWISSFVAMHLPQHVRVLPLVAEWLESFTVHSGPMRLTVVITGSAECMTGFYGPLTCEKSGCWLTGRILKECVPAVSSRRSGSCLVGRVGALRAP